MSLRNRISGDDNRGCGIAMIVLRNWQPRLRCRYRKINLRYRRLQRRHQRRIDYRSKVLETTTEAVEYQQRARWIGNNNVVLIFLAIALLIVTLYPIYLVDVLFWYCFNPIFFCLTEKNQYYNHAKNVFVPSVQ